MGMLSVSEISVRIYQDSRCYICELSCLHQSQVVFLCSQICILRSDRCLSPIRK
jgi:hypothetical protein